MLGCTKSECKRYVLSRQLFVKNSNGYFAESEIPNELYGRIDVGLLNFYKIVQYISDTNIYVIKIYPSVYCGKLFGIRFGGERMFVGKIIAQLDKKRDIILSYVDDNYYESFDEFMKSIMVILIAFAISKSDKMSIYIEQMYAFITCEIIKLNLEIHIKAQMFPVIIAQKIDLLNV